MTEAEPLAEWERELLRPRDPNVSEATAPLWVYVAGPMRGVAEFNFPAFAEATAQLRSRGYKVISPAEQDLGRGFDPSGLTGHEDMAALGFDLREALIADLNHVAFGCDAICLLPGWEFSKGAAAELALAEALGLPNGSLEDFLEADGWEPMTEHEFLQGIVRDLWPPSKPQACLGLVRSRFPDVPPVDATALVVDQIGARLGYAPCTYTPCSNCDDRKCMSCVFREVHDECRDDCPDCCPDLPAIIFPAEVHITSATGGQKGAKPARFELIPTGPLWDVAELYGYGASKYKEARNWERGYDWSLSYAALQRHANLFWSRENDDPETGLPHLAAVVFHALALMEYRTTHPEFDNRPVR